MHEFTEEEWAAEGREPVPEDRKAQPQSTTGFDSYIPWYMRNDFLLMGLADDDPIKADLLARSLRYDELIEKRWLKMSRIKANNDR